jgi:hypothetical protein
MRAVRRKGLLVVRHTEMQMKSKELSKCSTRPSMFSVSSTRISDARLIHPYEPVSILEPSSESAFIVTCVPIVLLI